MTAVAGTDHAFWHDGIGLFAVGTPFANDAGIEVLRGPRDYAAVRQALAHAGYNGEKIVVLAPTERRDSCAVAGGGRPAAPRRHECGLAGDGVRHCLPPAAQSRATGQGGLERVLLFLDRSAPNTNPYGNPGYARTGSPPSMVGRRARASKPCAPPGSTPATSMSSGGSAPSCRCNCGRTCPTFRWANIGNRPPIERICSTYRRAALRCFGVFAELDLNGVRSMAAPAFAPILEAARTRLGAGALEARLTSRARRPS